MYEKIAMELLYIACFWISLPVGAGLGVFKMNKPKLVVKSNHSQVLRDHHNELCNVLLDFAGKLYSKPIIDRETKTAVRRKKGYEAADILMDWVEIKIDQRPTSLVTVLQVMAELEILKHILEKIQKKREATKLEAEAVYCLFNAILFKEDPVDCIWHDFCLKGSKTNKTTSASFIHYL